MTLFERYDCTTVRLRIVVCYSPGTHQSDLQPLSSLLGDYMMVHQLLHTKCYEREGNGFACIVLAMIITIASRRGYRATEASTLARRQHGRSGQNSQGYSCVSCPDI